MGITDPDMATAMGQDRSLCAEAALSVPPQVFYRFLSPQHWAIQQLPPSIHLSSINK